MTTFWGPDLAALQATDTEIADVVLDEVDRCAAAKITLGRAAPARAPLTSRSSPRSARR